MRRRVTKEKMTTKQDRVKFRDPILAWKKGKFRVIVFCDSDYVSGEIRHSINIRIEECSFDLLGAERWVIATEHPIAREIANSSELLFRGWRDYENWIVKEIERVDIPNSGPYR